MNDLLQSAAWLREWTVNQSLPLWATAGFDARHGRFEERLTLKGEPIHDVPIRLIVQARQVYSFALASRLGWHGAARALFELAFETMKREYSRPDGRDGWVFSVNHDGSIADTKRDLYAHAFVLLAVASYVQASEKREALAIADETLAFLDRDLAAPQAGGYLDVLASSDPIRRQNPHMHMFESLLALWTASKERRYLVRAEKIFDLFVTYFFRPGTGVLTEYFDPALRPVEGETGEIVEPGHHCEWIWLLRTFERESGREVQPYVDALYAHAHRHGYDALGLVVDEVMSDGRVRLPSHRVWPTTEAIKANVVEAARGRAGAEQRVVGLVDALRNRFFHGVREGGWMDRLDKDGRAATDHMPASTLYHVLCAVDELSRFVDSRG
jgi:mannose-6-phosphate isomerase